MQLRLALTLLLAVPTLDFAAEPSPTGTPAKEKSGAAGGSYQWNEEPKTAATAAWLAQRLVAAQANNRPEIAQGLAEMLRTGNVTATCAQEDVFFFTKRGRDEKRASIYMRKSWEGKDERLIDSATVAGKDLTIADVSADGTLLAYGVAEGKAAERTIRIFDVKARSDLSDVLPAARYQSVSFTPERKGFYYARVEPAGTKIFLHTLGEAAADKYIFGESYFYVPLGPKDLISTEVTEREPYLLLSVRRGAEKKRVDVYAQDLKKPDKKVRPIIFGMDHRFSFVPHADDLFVLTDHEAPQQRVVKIAIGNPSPLEWVEIVPESADALSEIEIVGDKLFVTGAHNGASRTRIFTLDGKETGQIISPEMKFAQRVSHVCLHE